MLHAARGIRLPGGHAAGRRGRAAGAGERPQDAARGVAAGARASPQGATADHRRGQPARRRSRRRQRSWTCSASAARATAAWARAARDRGRRCSSPACATTSRPSPRRSTWPCCRHTARPRAWRCSRRWRCAVRWSRPNVGGVPEMVEDGVTGLLVPPRDPVALGQRDRAAADRPSAGGHARARRPRLRARELLARRDDPGDQRHLRRRRGGRGRARLNDSNRGVI